MTDNNRAGHDIPETEDLRQLRDVYRRGMIEMSSAGEGHADDEVWEKLATGQISQDERARVGDHLARCATCHQIYRAVMALQESARSFDPDVPLGAAGRSPELSGRRWRYAALAVAAVVVLGLVFRPVVFREAPQRETRTAPAASVVTLVAPLGDVTAAPSVFRWNAVDGARAYRVRLSSDEGVPIWTRDEVEGTSVRLPDSISLRRGRYFWRVTASADGDVIAESALTPFVVRP
jgi:hypothetical protein